MKKTYLIKIIGLFYLLIAGCTGADESLVYFPPPDNEQNPPVVASPAEAAGRSCDLAFSSQLCIIIKGDKVDVGFEAGSEVCAEVDAFPIHIRGNTISIKGSEFPDIAIEGHGLPVPIVINGKGDGSGENNVGEGEIDAAGNIKLNHFSFFINALGIAAEVSGLDLTTGSTGELDHIEAATGSPANANGAMTLVAGTQLGHTFDAADELLMGASMLATFTGAVSPTLSECGGNDAPRAVKINKLTIDTTGAQIVSPLPNETNLEISNGTYIASGAEDIGPHFEANESFRVENVGSRVIKLNIPAKIGAYYLSSPEPLTREFSPQQNFILNVSFRPKAGEAVPGNIGESLVIGTDLFQLKGIALDKSGSASVNSIDENGNIEDPNIDQVQVGDVSVVANTSKAFFQCKSIICNDSKSQTSCTPCPDPSKTACELLPVSTTGKPIGEVDKQCKLKRPEDKALAVIDLKGTANVNISAQSQVLAIRNYGVKDMTINAIKIADIPNSQSTGEFKLSDRAIFVANSFAEIQTEITQALAGEKPHGAKLPLTLPPFQADVNETTAYIIITYQPGDLIGSNGEQAGVGSNATDKAVVKIITENKIVTTEVSGKTKIHETAALELYFKTSTGIKHIADGKNFPLRGITAKTKDLAVPLFLRLADTAKAAMRVTSIKIAGDDETQFQWLNSADKIAAVQPAEEEGMRCSIPVLDPSSGEMIDEKFDLKPVSLSPPGVTIMPGAYTTENMPFFGCVNFHRTTDAEAKSTYQTNIVISAIELDSTNNPARNPDGSFRQVDLKAKLIAAIDPLKGKLVLRIVQTMAVILNKDFPTISGIATKKETEAKVAAGGVLDEPQVFTGALILDPFDEETIKSADGKTIASIPNDGFKTVFRALHTHPVNEQYDDPVFYDFAYLPYDSSRPEGERGIYEDYPNVPEDAKANGWRVFTASLSYPGPIAPYNERPHQISDCEVVNPCSEEGLKKFNAAGIKPGEKGACAFFYSSGGRYDSPAFHTEESMPGGTYKHQCDAVGEKQDLKDMNTGYYSLDGHITMEEVGLRMSGPTVFHNPGGILGNFRPLDAVFHTSFTTGTLKPQKTPEDYDVLPNQYIDTAKQMHKINLDDPNHINPPLCERNSDNFEIGGKTLSSWKYLMPLLSKDEEGKIPAGCPADDNDFTGGTAFMHGRPVDHETGAITFVSTMRFASDPKLSFALKDVMLFFVINGWLCDPTGDPENFEGSSCFDSHFNERDAVPQISLFE